jgi:hypothetical protein
MDGPNWEGEGRETVRLRSEGVRRIAETGARFRKCREDVSRFLA